MRVQPKWVWTKGRGERKECKILLRSDASRRDNAITAYMAEAERNMFCACVRVEVLCVCVCLCVDV